jgi:hypothetical protein
VQATELVGDVGGRPVIIVDDMISTGATIEAAAHLLLEQDAVPDITVAATHGCSSATRPTDWPSSRCGRCWSPTVSPPRRGHHRAATRRRHRAAPLRPYPRRGS